MRNFTGYEAVIFGLTIGVLCDMQINNNDYLKPKYKSCGKLLVGDEKPYSKTSDKKLLQLNHESKGLAVVDGLVNCNNVVGINEVNQLDSYTKALIKKVGSGITKGGEVIAKGLVEDSSYISEIDVNPINFIE